MLVSKATKLLELGHSDFDQVYAMRAGWSLERLRRFDRDGGLALCRAESCLEVTQFYAVIRRAASGARVRRGPQGSRSARVRRDPSMS